jgi:hypothetical protein
VSAIDSRNRLTRSPQRPAVSAGGINTPGETSFCGSSRTITPNPSGKPGKLTTQFRVVIMDNGVWFADFSVGSAGARANSVLAHTAGRKRPETRLMARTVSTERLDTGVVLVTLNRPERLNAMTYALVHDLHEALERRHAIERAGL